MTSNYRKARTLYCYTSSLKSLKPPRFKAEAASLGRTLMYLYLCLSEIWMNVGTWERFLNVIISPTHLDVCSQGSQKQECAVVAVG